MAKILIVEDDLEMSKLLIEWLEKDHHVVDSVADGGEGLDRLLFYSYDLAVIDFELPSINGPDICSEFRSKGGKIPLLMLTGKSAIEHKLTGFGAGADDYLTKPFHPLELKARLNALLARPADRVVDVLVAGDLELNSSSHILLKAGKEVHLMPREFALLELFMRHPGEPFAPEALLNLVWSSESDASPMTVKAHIAKLRRKIDDNDGESRITTVHGVGYKLRV